ncbi:hypothetical protein LY78DRAFT_673217 [Colletotrichum sublineola]|nr:hypothetical protein LY78DRAFT_673217 [Colletotrichum sublineola]
MKYRTAEICISVCHSRDESVYDCFKDLFKEVVTFAKSILDSCPEALKLTNSAFDFDKSSYLSILRFIILKCRWLDIRYKAWLIFKTFAEPGVKTVRDAGIDAIGELIKTEHGVRIEDAIPDGAEL